MKGFGNTAAEKLHEPGMIYGKMFTGESINISDKIDHDEGTVVVNGKVEEIVYRELRGDHLQVTIVLRDDAGDSKLPVKLITYTKFKGELNDLLKPGLHVSACGIITFDIFEKTYVLNAVKGIKEAFD